MPAADKRPRVALFSNQFGDASGHGLSRYSRELFRALCELHAAEVTPVAGWSSLAQEELTQLKQTTGFRLTGLGRRGTSLLWTLLDGPTIETCLGAPFDVVHAAALGYPVATRVPFVVTIHDLGPLTHPHFFRATRPWVMQRSLAQAIAKASHIVCVSQSTANEVRDYVGSDLEGRVRVIHEGVSQSFFAPAPEGALSRFDLPEDVPFILSAGKLSPRKNLHGLLRAMRHVVGEIPHQLVLVGGLGWDTDVFQSALAETN
ncbi:MAG: glycosyltransferase, partial [Pseudomonadota bacterium]